MALTVSGSLRQRDLVFGRRPTARRREEPARRARARPRPAKGHARCAAAAGAAPDTSHAPRAPGRLRPRPRGPPRAAGFATECHARRCRPAPRQPAARPPASRQPAPQACPCARRAGARTCCSGAGHGRRPRRRVPGHELQRPRPRRRSRRRPRRPRRRLRRRRSRRRRRRRASATAGATRAATRTMAVAGTRVAARAAGTPLPRLVLRALSGRHRPEARRGMMRA